VEFARKRTHLRYKLEMPVAFDTGAGLTRNICAGGIYFETDQHLSPGAKLHLRVTLPSQSDPALRVDCVCTVLRSDDLNGSVGVAATIDGYEWIGVPS
jgi:hypothetical protein